jgi:SAM-dependent methyltransferase
MEFKKSYFDSGKEYNQNKGLYRVRNLFSKEIITKKSKKHFNLFLENKWKNFIGCSKVLDAGCGRGEFMELNPYHMDVYGIDIIKDEIDDLKKRGFNVRVANLDKKLKFKDSFFDGINCSHVLEHMENPENMISEFKRILKDGGILAISVPNFSFKHFYKDPTHKRPYPKEALFRILYDRGFSDIHIKNGIATSQVVNALFFFFPTLRFNIKKFLGRYWPSEYTAVAKNKK